MFTRDNTDGLYTPSDLEVMNAALESVRQEVMVNPPNRDDFEKYVSDEILNEYMPGDTPEELCKRMNIK